MAWSNCSNFPTENISWIGYCKEVNQRLVIRPLTNKVRREYCVSYTTIQQYNLYYKNKPLEANGNSFGFLESSQQTLFLQLIIMIVVEPWHISVLSLSDGLMISTATTLQTFVTKQNRWTTTFSLSANNTTLQHLNLAVEKLIMGNLARWFIFN